MNLNLIEMKIYHRNNNIKMDTVRGLSWDAELSVYGVYPMVLDL